MKKRKYKHLEIFTLIDELYPRGIVGGFKKKDKKLYEKFKELAKNENKTLKEFFIYNGYDYYRKDINDIHKSNKVDLLKLFPDKKITDLHGKNSKLYFKILNHSKIEHDSIEEYLNWLGFEYDKYNNSSTIKDIFKSLNNMFPDKVISKLSVKNQLLYSKIYKLAKKENLSVDSFLQKKGYDVAI